MLGITLVIFGIGLFFIIKGGEYFAGAARRTALFFGMPKFAAAARSLGMALPALLVSLTAVMDGRMGLGAGCALGAALCNLGAVSAFCLWARPDGANRREIAEQGGLLALSALMLLWAARDGWIGPGDCLPLYALAGVFVCLSARSAKRPGGGNGKPPAKAAWPDALLAASRFIFGAAALVCGARLLVSAGGSLARYAGISESVFGLALMAPGLMLPAVAAAAARLSKGEAAPSAGSIWGRSILPFTLIFPTCAIAAGGLPVDTRMLRHGGVACLLMVAAAVFPALAKRRFSRWQGAFMACLYVAYLFLLVTGAAA